MSDEIWRKSARELAQLISSKELSSVEVVQAHLERIDEVNPALNAIAVTLGDEALAAAESADSRLRSGEGPIGPLHGVPVTIKENLDVAGTATTNGVPSKVDAYVDRDAPLVERLRNAGAIVVGRTNLPDLGLRIHTQSSLRGLTRNPWHRGRTTGGSSGGDASALASGMTPLGIGNDIGGSLRSPAHCCGISSIKPTTGRIPMATDVEPIDGPLSFQMLLVNGVMARNIADVRLGLNIVSGAHPRDPESMPVPPTSVESAGTRGRVAVVAEPPGGSTHPGVAAIVREAGERLARAGYEVEEVTPPDYETAINVWHEFLFTELRVAMPELRPVMGEEGRRFIEAVIDNEPVLDLKAFVDLFSERRRIARVWLEFFESYSVVLSPIWTQPAFEHGWDAESTANSLGAMELSRPVTPANFLGLPAAATPGGFIDGVPVGVQCIAAPWREDIALDAAAAIEAEVGVLTPVSPFVNERP